MGYQRRVHGYTYLFKNKKFFNNLVKSYIIKIVSKIPFASCKNKNLKYYQYYKLFLKILYFYYCNKNLYNKIFSVICFYKIQIYFFQEKFKKLLLNLINKFYKNKNRNFYLSFLKFIIFNILIKYYLTCSVIILNSRISAKVAK